MENYNSKSLDVSKINYDSDKEQADPDDEPVQATSDNGDISDYQNRAKKLTAKTPKEYQLAKTRTISAMRGP
jgi:hypothetical protein